MKIPRYVLEGTWSGYHSGQRHVCHRTVTTRPERYKGIDSILFSDGTYMSVRLRQCKPREKIQEIHRYDELFRRVADQGLKGSVSVMQVN